MRSFADLTGSRVGIWGFGVEGRATLSRLRAQGCEPVVVVDAKPGRLEDGTVVLDLDGGLPLLRTCEVVVKSPGISRYDAVAVELAAAGAQVLGGLGLWLDGAPRDRVVCVTGTKGKSTTSSILATLLTGLGHRCFVGGNLGSPPWDPAAGEDPDFWVIETSSYQATDVMLGPATVVVTSLSEDHVPWHGSVEQYYRDKLSLCTKPGVRTVLASADDPGLQAHAGLLGPDLVWVSGAAGRWADGLRVLGEHNRRNAELARRTLAVLGIDADDEALARAAATYVPLPSRLTLVATAGGVDFDDSLSTNVLPTLAAVRSFPGRRIALLAGGSDRAIDYSGLGPGIAAAPSPVAVFTMPDNGPAIGAAVRASSSVEVVDCEDLAEAVRRGFAWAQPDGVVLLSPAAASFGRFADYRERAARFTDLALTTSRDA